MNCKYCSRKFLSYILH